MPTEIQRQFGQRHRTDLVGQRHTTHIGGQITQYKIEPMSFQPGLQLAHDGLLAEIALQEIHPRNALHGQDVQREYLAGLAQAVAHQLRPTARRRAKIHHIDPGLQQPVTLDQLLQLIYRT